LIRSSRIPGHSIRPLDALRCSNRAGHKIRGGAVRDVVMVLLIILFFVISGVLVARLEKLR